MKLRKVVPALLRLIFPEITIKWHKEQFCKLNSMSLNLISFLVTVLPEEFLLNDGPVRITLLIDIYNKIPYNAGIVLSCLKVILAGLKTNNVHVIEKFRNQNLFDSLIGK